LAEETDNLLKNIRENQIVRKNTFFLYKKHDPIVKRYEFSILHQ